MRIELAPITAAPVKPGEYFGLCLLAPGVKDEWVVGCWNGEGWYQQGAIAEFW